MNIAVKKVELIEWIARLQDEKLIQRIEFLKNGSLQEMYNQRILKTEDELDSKIDNSEKDIIKGKMHSQKDVEGFFKNKFNS